MTRRRGHGGRFLVVVGVDCRVVEAAVVAVLG